MTIAKLIADPTARSWIDSRSVLIVDEAGAVGLDDMVKLVELAELQHARMIFSGDTGQHASVPRGDALRVIEDFSPHQFAELTTIRRQKREELRRVVKLAADGRSGTALEALERLGAVTAESPLEDGRLNEKAAANRSAAAAVDPSRP
jgi:ATP-dependent exoDNAse (exonuclease V) alpha subunit